MVGTRWLRKSSHGVLGKADSRRKGSNHDSSMTHQNQMENKIISHWLSQRPKQMRTKGGKPPSPPTLEALMKGVLLRVTSKVRSFACQLCAGCGALQFSREKFTGHGQSLNKHFCHLCPLPFLVPSREFASSLLKPKTSPVSSHHRGVFLACTESVSCKAGTDRSHMSAMQPTQINVGVN